ncbi:MAG TPA: hypothetical protein VJC16_07235 [Candidatus Nanoarchaeia archaeon]|nr:hypothetical protein [Candidatus Nanoarchaeia archaeon]
MDTCAVCKKIIRKGVISAEGRKFCSQACSAAFKKAKKGKETCEFC